MHSVALLLPANALLPWKQYHGIRPSARIWSFVIFFRAAIIEIYLTASDQSGSSNSAERPQGLIICRFFLFAFWPQRCLYTNVTHQLAGFCEILYLANIFWENGLDIVDNISIYFLFNKAMRYAIMKNVHISQRETYPGFCRNTSTFLLSLQSKALLFCCFIEERSTSISAGYVRWVSPVWAWLRNRELRIRSNCG